MGNAKMKTPDEILTPEGDELLTKTCRECQQPFDIDLRMFSAYLAGTVKVCPDCSEKHSMEAQRQAIVNSAIVRGSLWRSLCPPDFFDTLAERLPQPSKLQEVLRWRYGLRGLILHGPTGLGKSRCAWKLMERESRSGRSIACLGAMAAIEYGARYGESAGSVEDWMHRQIRVDILLLDDIFKNKLTDSFEMAVFTIISMRTERQRPVILTSNDTPETLMNRMSPDRAKPLMRRLIEYCHTISFT